MKLPTFAPSERPLALLILTLAALPTLAADPAPRTCQNELRLLPQR